MSEGKAMTESRNGYLQPLYAESFREHGEVVELPRSGCQILKREIPGFPNEFDAMAIYPFLFCANWKGLAEDLNEIDDLVSLTAVPDPFGAYDVELLTEAFPDFLNLNYKVGEAADLSIPYVEYCSQSRRKAAIAAMKKLTIEVAERPSEQLDEWTQLYRQLIAKHNITGMRAFSRAVLERQFSTDGLVYIQAKYEGKTIGVHTWIVQGDVAYAHLAAHDLELGYRHYAPSALYWFAYEYFATKVRWLFYGGAAAGANTDKNDKLINFKKSWGSGTRPVYLGGRIIQPERYSQMANGHPLARSCYFPAYRAGEFS